MPQQNNNELGMIGLGVMGRNLLLNMASHGFKVAGFDKDPKQIEQLAQMQHQNISPKNTLQDFIQCLQKPRAIMLLIPAGLPVDSVIQELLPFLEKNDLIIDGGNSHFTDTDRRQQFLQEKGIQFLGVGISGGEKGARNGPSIMPGGPKPAYERIQPIFEAIAAHVRGEPCVNYIGQNSAGHYVKMVHNGIEYGLMQLIAETYDAMKHGLGLNNQELSEIYHRWNEAKLNSYLLEITANIFERKDDITHQPLIDVIRGVAEQKGTGMWTSQSAMTLQVPVPTIDIAVSMRDLSGDVDEHSQAETLYQRPIEPLNIDKKNYLQQLESALYISMIITYAQGMALLYTASKQYHYHLNLEVITALWRGGCIIRSALLEDFRAAFQANQKLIHLLLDPRLAQKIMEHQEDLRKIVLHCVHMGIAMPAFMSVLGYFDAYRKTWQPSNLIQAQRDYFGSHAYARIDREGKFHTAWDEAK